MTRRKGIRVVVALGDIHAGSTVALMPPGFRTLEGQEQKPNAIQSWLWECFRDAMDVWLPDVLNGDPFALVLTGDLTEGIHHRTKQVWSADTADHVNAAIEIVEPLSGQAVATYVVKGTECHSGTSETSIGKVLKAEPDPETRNAAWDRLSLTVAGTRCVFQHHISATVRSYLEASGMGIALGNEQLEAAKSGEAIPKVLVSAHRHRYGEFRDATGLSVVTPPWQALNRHGFKVVPSARTRPGLVVLDWRNRKDGELPETHARTYRAPEALGARI